MNVAPGASYTSRLALGVASTGLVGTVRFRLLDNDLTVDDPVYGPSTASIIEDPTGSGSYLFHGTAPATAGVYSPAWQTGASTDLIYDEELVVTFSTASVSTSNVYATRNEIKASLDATNTTYLDDDIDDALNAASRAIDEACGRRFFPTTETRVYTAGRFPYSAVLWQRVCDVEIDDLNALTTLKVDIDGDGVFETTWTSGTDFYLDPPNAALQGYPYERVVLRQQAGRVFPTWDNSIQIVGSFGWAETPPEVKQYTKLFATQLLLRTQQAPFGVLMAGSEIGSTTRISRFDPDFNRMLGHLVKPHQLIA